jgi:hypothetical protein
VINLEVNPGLNFGVNLVITIEMTVFFPMGEKEKTVIFLTNSWGSPEINF